MSARWPFRPKGTLLRFALDRPLPAGDAQLLAALAEHRFRPIERAADEEPSLGWVSPADPEGGRFPAEAHLIGSILRLVLRCDRKKLPALWLRLRVRAEVAARGGRVAPKERREIRERILRERLPQVPPAVRLIDVLVDRRTREVLAFGLPASLLGKFAALFLATFDRRLEPLTPGRLASRLLPESAGLSSDLHPLDLSAPRSTAPLVSDREVRA